MSQPRIKRVRKIAPQQSANLAAALLTIDAAIEASLVTEAGVIDPEKCREQLRSLRQRGFEPQDNVVEEIVSGLCEEIIGAKI